MYGNSAFQMKGSLFTLPVLKLILPDLDKVDAELGRAVTQTPKLFEHAPIMVDLSHLKDSDIPIHFTELNNILRKHTLVPVGVRGGNSTQHDAAVDAGFALLPEHKTSETVDIRTETKKPNSNRVDVPTKIITEPVRSGSQIYVKGGDLIILASVSPGAEVLADGSIHVYGPLRGRALAGVQGDKSARIFCKTLDAELVSIAGVYQVNEDLTEQSKADGITQIYLTNQDHLAITQL